MHGPPTFSICSAAKQLRLTIILMPLGTFTDFCSSEMTILILSDITKTSLKNFLVAAFCFCNYIVPKY